MDVEPAIAKRMDLSLYERVREARVQGGEVGEADPGLATRCCSRRSSLGPARAAERGLDRGSIAPGGVDRAPSRGSRRGPACPSSLLRCGSWRGPRARRRTPRCRTDRRSARPRGRAIRSQVAPRVRGRDQRQPRGRRLEQDDPERVLEGREGEDVGLRVARGHLGVIDEPGELGPRGRARGELAEAGLLRPGPDHDQADLGMLDPPPRPWRASSLSTPLWADQAAGGQDREPSPFSYARSLAIRQRRSRVEEWGARNTRSGRAPSSTNRSPRPAALRDAGRGRAQEDAPGDHAGGGRACSRSRRCRRCR